MLRVPSSFGGIEQASYKTGWLILASPGCTLRSGWHVAYMVRDSSGARLGTRCYFLIAASAAAVIITSSGADARHHGSANRINRDQSANLNTHAQEYLPPSASIVVDGYSGAVLQASNPDALRHPASLAKIMTLYLLFERLDTGRVICQQSQGNAFFSITDAVADILLGYLDGKAVASLR